MKSRILVVAALAAVITLVIAGAATAGVVGTKHDITTLPNATGPGLISSTSEVCVYCHTPHGANVLDYTGAPLWNKTNISGTYQAYASTTMNATPDSSIGAVTKACLSCHDGSLAVFSMINPPNSGGYVNGVTAASTNINASGQIINNPQLNWDMRNDHPVSMTYMPASAGGDSGLAPTPPAATPLFGGKVECGSCHNVHDNSKAPFLRMANTASALCLACHTNK